LVKFFEGRDNTRSPAKNFGIAESVKHPVRGVAGHNDQRELAGDSVVGVARRSLPLRKYPYRGIYSDSVD